MPLIARVTSSPKTSELRLLWDWVRAKEVIAISIDPFGVNDPRSARDWPLDGEGGCGRGKVTN